jgi:hypothetical protein
VIESDDEDQQLAPALDQSTAQKRKRVESESGEDQDSDDDVPSANLKKK